MSAVPALPDIDGARLPQTYQAAQRALAECSRIDECLEWANKADALASYAKQSKDETLRKHADRIQARAIRRCGELLKQIPDNSRGRPSELSAQKQRKIDRVQHDLSEGQITRDEANEKIAQIDPDWATRTRTNAAICAGLSQHQKDQSLRVASVPESEFDAAVESDEPPTVTALAERGKKTKLVDLGDIPAVDYARATEAQGTLKRFAEFCAQYEPARIARAFKPHEIRSLRAYIATVDTWLDQFVVNLPE